MEDAVKIGGEQTKQCRKCGAHKPLSAFSSNSGAKDKLNHSCRACVAQRDKERWARERAAKAAAMGNNKEELAATSITEEETAPLCTAKQNGQDVITLPLAPFLEEDVIAVKPLATAEALAKVTIIFEGNDREMFRRLAASARKARRTVENEILWCLENGVGLDAGADS